MNTKRSIAAAALVALAAVAGACSSDPKNAPATSAGAIGSSSTTTSASSLKWTAEAKTSVRSLMAMAAQGTQLDCAVDVVTSVYTPEDWTYLVAHMNQTDEPAALKAKDDAAAKEMESRCGIKDTRAEDAAKDAAMKAWNDAVGEWNKLTEQRDATGAKTVVVNGQSFEDYKAWAAANGKPTEMPK